MENLFGFTIDEVKNNPQVGEAWLRSVLDGAKTVLEGSASTSAEEREAARDIMRQVRTRFEAAGIRTNATMEQLPDRLAANVFHRDQEKQAEDLSDLASQLEQTVAKIGTALRTEAERLKTEVEKMDNEL
ncbi:MAG: hypothetical protein KDJ52_05110 [Anaerolineae bacterium]|nr:hypothetical protein [Anaerolineae bacterium]